MSADQYLYPFDPTGAATTNLVVGERQTINPPAMDSFYYIVPLAGPYFRESLKVFLYPDAIQLQEGVHYSCSHMFHAATQATGMGIYGSITFFDHTLTGTVSLEYQTLGGDWTISEAKIAELLANTMINPRITTWEQVVDVPYQFPPINHEFNINDFVGADDIVTKLQLIVDALNAGNGAGLVAHLADLNNPHQTTKEQVGLGLVENYPVAAVGEAQAGALNNRFMTPLRTRQLVEAIVYDRIDTHVNRTDNPHSTTKAHVGLGSVENYGIATQAESELGASNARYMTPLRVKDAINYQVLNAFNTFIARRDNPHVVTKTQVGLDQVENFPVATIEQAQAGVDSNAYMTPLRTKQAIDALGIGSINAHVSNFNNPHNTTKAQLGLGNVDNYATASQLEAEEATANDKFMTPLRVRQLLAVLGAGSDTHMVDYDNPHQTTKDQVGLGAVENYTIANQLEAEAGDLNDRYMTPMRTKQAIVAVLSGSVGTHLTNYNNPHNVTKAQIGLDLVENYGIASQVEAEAGDLNDRYMTPLRVKEAIMALSGAALSSHLADYNNPHQTTKEQVGLGSVEDYATANQLEAEAGDLNDRYMTPLRTKQAIMAVVGAALSSHLTDYNNPHQVTADQVGAYSIAEIDAMVLNLLTTSGTAYDSARLFGYDQIAFEDYIETLKAGDTVLAYGLTKAQLVAELDTGGGPVDASTLNGLTSSQIITQAAAQATSVVETTHKVLPAIGVMYDYTDPLVPVVAPMAESWTKIASIVISNPGRLDDVAFSISGGGSFADPVADGYNYNTMIKAVFDVYDSGSGTTPLISINAQELGGKTAADGAPTFQYREYTVDEGTPVTYIEIWCHDLEKRSALSMTKITGDVQLAYASSNDDISLAITEQPIGLVDIPLEPHLRAETQNALNELQTALDALITAHSVP